LPKMMGPMKSPTPHDAGVVKSQLHRPLADFLRPGPPPLRIDHTVEQSLGTIRATGFAERIFYFYVIDGQGCLSGVVPARKLLTEPLNRKIGEIMMSRVLSLPESATLLEACECFILHKFLAIPVIDAKRRLLGIIDVGIFTDEVMELGESGANDQLFQAIGIHIQELMHASAWKAFKIRFPWLTVTILGGGLCALMAEEFSATLQHRIVLSVFLALVLGLSEAVSSQSLALTIQLMPSARMPWRWLAMRLRREALTASFLGLVTGSLVAFVVRILWNDPSAAFSIGGSVFLSILTAGLLGVLVPSLLRVERWDPKIAAGPLTLALADLFTVASYLITARLLLG